MEDGKKKMGKFLGRQGGGEEEEEKGKNSIFLLFFLISNSCRLRSKREGKNNENEMNQKTCKKLAKGWRKLKRYPRPLAKWPPFKPPRVPPHITIKIKSFIVREGVGMCAPAIKPSSAGYP